MDVALDIGTDVQKLLPSFEYNSNFFPICNFSAMPINTYENDPDPTLIHHQPQKNCQKPPKL